jgi:hypothetical protein
MASKKVWYRSLPTDLFHGIATMFVIRETAKERSKVGPKNPVIKRHTEYSVDGM